MRYMICLIVFILCLVSSFFAQSLRINEFLASNLIAGMDEYGEYEDWIEIYNPSGAAVDIANYFVTDDLTDLAKWQIPSGDLATVVPAGGYLLLWADTTTAQGTLHLPFKLTKEGEAIALVQPDGSTILDAITYPFQHADVSMGRDSLNAALWRYFDKPTPGTANGVGFLGVTEPPAISLAPGIYSSSQTAEISSSEPGAIIRYTLDYFDPAETSPEYAGAISVSNTTILRARAFKPGYIPGEIPSPTFFVNENAALPTLSVVTDPDHLWDSNTGIYIKYNDEGVEWERPVYQHYFKDDQLQFSLKSGIRIQGRSSRLRPKKSFRLFYKSAYNQEWLNYPMFENSPVASFRNLVLRSGYDDDIQMSNGSLLRDPLVSEIWQGIGELSSRGNFAVLYLNDQYWGIYNIRESVNEHFISSHEGYESFDLIRYLKQNIDLKFGALDEWNALHSFIRSSDFSQPAAYQAALDLIDMDNFLNLQALIICAEYRSWGWGASAYKEHAASGKWRWTIWDMDRAFTNTTWNGFTFLNDTTGLEEPNVIAFQLLKNSTFKRDYINRIADFLNTYFLPNRVIAKIDSLAAIIEPEIPAEASRWSRTVSHWQNGVQGLRTFAQVRPGIVKQQLENYFSLGGWSNLTIDASTGGTLKINTISPESLPWSGEYFHNNPVRVSAIPEPGYELTGWSDASLGNATSVDITLSSDMALTAYFAPADTTEKIEIIAPAKIRAGDHLPIVARVRLSNGKMNAAQTFQATILSESALADTMIKIKKGTGTAVLPVSGNASFVLGVDYPDLNVLTKNIEVVTAPPAVNYSGTLPLGQTIWDASADRMIDGDITVPLGSELIIEAGTRVLWGDKVNMTVNGSLVVNGTAAAPVLFTSDDWNMPWGGIEFFGSNSSVTYCFFINGGGDPTKGWAHTNKQPILFARDNSELSLKNVFILNCPGKALGGLYSIVNVDQCVTSFVFQGGEFHYTMLNYENSYVMNIPNDDGIFMGDQDNDGFHIDYVHPDATEPSRIRNSFFLTGKDDAIDHNNANIEVINCWLEDWVHEGIAASNGNTIRAINTVAKDCQQGFEAGWGSPNLILEHCVAVNNDVGIRFGDSYHNPVTGQITATDFVAYDNIDNIKNFVKYLNGPNPGRIDISFSMTNDAEHDSFPFCITGVPDFDDHYRLKPGSPGRVMGIGGKHLGIVDSTMLVYGPAMVNEIMYRPSGALDSKDWIELYNPNSSPIDISAWVLKDDDNAHAFTVPANVIIPAKSYHVLCRDTLAFKAIYPNAENYTGNFDFGFGQGDQVRIYARTASQVDSLAYLSVAPWPASPNGNGPSLELIDITDNLLPENWTASTTTGGTPGFQNSLVGNGTAPQPQIAKQFRLMQNYPNPFNPSTKIQYELPYAADVTLEIFNILGQKVRTLVHTKQIAGFHQTAWDGRNHQNVPVTSGIYIYRLKAGEFIKSKKMILVR